jgi:hypothetical protein
MVCPSHPLSKIDVQPLGAGSHGRLKKNDWPTRPALAAGGGTLTCPEERLVDEPLRQLAGTHPKCDKLDKIHLWLKPSLQPDDQPIAQAHPLLRPHGRDGEL